MNDKASIDSEKSAVHRPANIRDVDEEVDAFEHLKGTEGYVEYRTLDWFQAGGLLLAETLALGVLSFPNLAAQIGVAPTIVATIILAFLAWITGYILVDFKVNHPSVMNFADVGRIIGGPIFKWVMLIGIVLKSVLIQASHINSGGTAFTEMSRNARCSVLLCFCMALLGFVCTIPRKFSHASWASFVSCISIITACLITIIACGANQAEYSDATWRAANNPGVTGVVNSLTNMIFAYGGHAAIFAFVSEMKKPNDFKKSLAMVQIVSTSFYITIGVGVYMLVGEENVKSPALSIPGYKLETAAYAIALISITISGVIPALNGIKQIWVEAFRGKKMLTSNDWKTYTTWIALAFTTWMIGFFLAQLIPFFSSLLSIISSVLTVWFTYGISGMMWLYDNRKGSNRSPEGWFSNRQKTLMFAFSVFIIIMSSVITPLGMYSAIESIKDGYSTGANIIFHAHQLKVLVHRRGFVRTKGLSFLFNGGSSTMWKAGNWDFIALP
ncbi:hypothetical protein E3P94_00943 [Wallemia ichthyophaga]|nr:hypothetical protein E3P95_00811 [Wallemia ichthyophaga]TIB03569.1 hypothetical protein E3P94_00943 [Wallemia ichthyophaga]